MIDDLYQPQSGTGANLRGISAQEGARLGLGRCVCLRSECVGACAPGPRAEARYSRASRYPPSPWCCLACWRTARAVL